MAKRYTDSLKWDDPFFADLSNEYKLLWIFILDKCNHAGIYKVNPRMAEFCLGTKYDWTKVLGVFKGRIQSLNDEKWFIPKFIEYQYGVLVETNRVHHSILQILTKEGLYKDCSRTILGSKDKDKEKDKVKDKEKENSISLFWEHYLLKTQKKFTLTTDKKALIKKRLETHSLEDLKRAVDNFVIDDWEGRASHLDLIYCIGKQQGKPDNLDKWLNKAVVRTNDKGEVLREGTNIPERHFK